MSDLTFVQQQDCTELYYAQCDAASGGDGSQVVYLLPEGTEGPQNLDLASTWSGTPYATGWYFFLDTPITPGTEASFARNAWFYLEMPGRSGVRFAWIANPNDVANPLAGPSMAVQATAKGYETGGVTQFNFQNMVLIIGPGCPVTLEGTDFLIAPNAATPHSIYLQAQWGQTTLDVVDPAGITLPCCPPASGYLQFVTHLQTQTDLATLDVGLRMFYPTVEDSEPVGSSSAGDSFFLTSQRYPVFQEDSGTLTLYATLDPLAPLDDTRTWWSFTSPDGATDAAPPIDSYYRTNLGYVAQLTPQANARLVFASRPVAGTPSPADPYYLVPQGDFSIGVVRAGGTAVQSGDSLMCGLSGVEYVNLAPGQANLLTFSPGHGGYAPGFIPGQPPSAAAAGQGLPDPPPTPVSATTSWAYLQAPAVSTGLTYCAQPDDATLHSPDAPGGQPNPCPSALFFKEIGAAQLEAANTYSSSPTFPLMPYAGPLDSDVGAATYEQFELQVLSPVRRTKVPGTVSSAAATSASTPCDFAQNPSDHLYPTPQGLMGIFSDDTPPIWKQLILASDATIPVPQQIVFTCLSQGTALRSAVQTNQMFLVISNQGTLPDPTQLSDHYAGTNLTIQQWTFDLSLANWSQHRTILILKFYGKPLQDLAGDTSTWTMPGSFNGDPQDVSQQLMSILQDAQTTYTNGDPETRAVYDHFVNRVMTDPGWSGVLALRVNCPTNDLPADLAGLAAGIDTSQFYAHHLGVEVTPIDLSNSQLSIKPSSLFGLIDYANPQYPPPNATGYNFKVDTLRVLFSNSQIASFSSQIELTMDKLFGEETKLVDSPSGRNNVVLNGRYDTHGSRPGYIYTFNGQNVFSLPSSRVFNGITVTQAQFVTNAPANGFQNGATVVSRFSLWGEMDFQAIKGFDLFSFGADAGSTGSSQYLSFSNLGVVMTFTWGNPTTTTFTFDPSQVTFDPQRCVPRSQSLFAHFPMTIAGLTFSDGDKKPADLGYLPVQSPLVSPGLDPAWYGLIFNLDLGSLGALAAGAGLTVRLLTAWSPNPSGLSAFFGLEVPGAGGAKTLSLQGVLKLVFGSIQMVVTTDGGSTGYLLKLKNIALKLLALTFPPNGQTEIIIFGDPQETPSNRTLGWYAAYAENQPQQPGSSSTPALPAPSQPALDGTSHV